MAARLTWHAVCLSALAVLVWNTDANASGFKVKGLVTVDAAPMSIATADFNHDGKLDLAVASLDSNATVSVLMGNGDGTFQPQVRYGVGSFPGAVAVGDVNLDDNIDLVVANEADDTTSVLLGNGDGTFQSSLTFSTGNAPSDVALGDFNGDGILDVVTASAGVTVFLGNGDGTFQPAITVASNAYSVAVGDFNHDHKLDLAIGTVSGSSGMVQILFGNGDGTFQIGTSYSLNVATPYSIAVGDLNNDGKLDLAVSTFDLHVTVLIGRGDGTFNNGVDYTTFHSSVGVLIADFNRDGNPDVAAAGFDNPSYASVLNGNGDGTFQPVINYNGQGRYADAIVAPDLNGDGSPDLVLANDSSSNLTVFLNTGGTRVTTTSSLNPSHVGQTVTFTTAVKASVSGTGVPTGTVTFKDGRTTLGTVSLSSGKASFTTSTLSQGKHQIVASYSGDVNFNPNTAKALVQFVKP